jgi:hypothetical protein
MKNQHLFVGFLVIVVVYVLLMECTKEHYSVPPGVSSNTPRYRDTPQGRKYNPNPPPGWMKQYMHLCRLLEGLIREISDPYSPEWTEQQRLQLASSTRQRLWRMEDEARDNGWQVPKC